MKSIFGNHGNHSRIFRKRPFHNRVESELKKSSEFSVLVIRKHGALSAFVE